MVITIYKNPCSKSGVGYRGVEEAARLIGKCRTTITGFLDGSRPSRTVERLFKHHRITVVRA